MIPKYISLKEQLNQDILKNKYPIGSKLPTEVQLAEEYGVSRSTVRQALKLLCDQGIISKRWGSGNTVLAKSNKDKAGTVVILLPSLKDPAAKEFVADATSVLVKNGMVTEVFETKNHFQIERDHLKDLLNDMYGGLIISCAHSILPSTNIDILQQLLKRQLPIVFVNSAPAGVYNPLVVSFDHYHRGYFMARSLINTGYKKLGAIFVGGLSSSASAYSGFVDAIRDAGLYIYDECLRFMGANESTVSINKFLKNALNTVDVVYSDHTALTGDGTFPVYTSTLETGKSLGKECAHGLLLQKKNGNSKSVTIPYRT
jgi:GntR family transcriptional regulator of arabinose operon